MPDLTPDLLPLLRRHRLPGLDLGRDVIYPDYTGRSVLNLPASLCRLLGVPEFGPGPLEEDLLAPLGEAPFRRVILILVDALALHRLQRWIASGDAPVWGALAQQGVLAPLTSLVPSTTSTVLTSLWTGRSPAEHGIVGYELWLKEYGVVANMLLHTPISFQGDAGSLSRAGLTPQTFLPFSTLGSHLAAHAVHTFAFQHYTLARSSLSEMLFQDVTQQAFGTASDLWGNVRRLIESQPAERMFVWVYWGEVDAFGHRYGPDDERTVDEFSSFSSAFERLFLSRLSASERQDTLVLLTGDHGQIMTTPDPHYQLRSHPNLARRLHILPTGEHRLPYLYVRPGQTEAVREYLERAWPKGFALVDPAYAVESGLYGPGAAHPRLLDRLGDFIAAAQGYAYLWWSEKEDRMLGQHGGLSPDEMLVPLLAARAERFP